MKKLILAMSFVANSLALAAEPKSIFVNGPTTVIPEGFDGAQPTESVVSPNYETASFKWNNVQSISVPRDDMSCSTKLMVAKGGNVFVSANSLEGRCTGVYGQGGTMSRSFKFKIASRDPNVTYRIIASQAYSFKAPDTRGTSISTSKKKSSVLFTFDCRSENYSKKDSYTLDGLGGSTGSKALNIVDAIAVGQCASNEFELNFYAYDVQDLDIPSLELMILEVLPN